MAVAAPAALDKENVAKKTTEYSAPWVEKYRPRTLDDVLGNEETVLRLRAIAKDGNMPNLILCGPPGTGMFHRRCASKRRVCVYSRTHTHPHRAETSHARRLTPNPSVTKTHSFDRQNDQRPRAGSRAAGIGLQGRGLGAQRVGRPRY